MITSLRLVDFKNFADETLRIGPFTVIVGANASGKSNIRDAFRFLHGIGRGYTLAEIFGGKYGAGGQVEWEAIRGANNEINRFGQKLFSAIVEFKIANPLIENRRFNGRYLIQISIDKETNFGFHVTKEELMEHTYEPTYTTHPKGKDRVRYQDDETHLLVRMGRTGNQKRIGYKIMVRPDKPALTQIKNIKNAARIHKGEVLGVIESFASMRFFDLVPDRMRQPSFPGQTVLGDGGENLPTVLQEICADGGRKDTLIEWTRELTPMDVRDLEFPVDPITGRIQLVIREANDRKVSAYGASDGTLRFLAMLAALLGKDPARLYLFEEIDNGIHPSRLHLLIDLIERQTAKEGIQVITTTHSPDLLSMLSDKAFGYTSVVCRLDDTEDAIIRPVAEIRNAEELRRKQGLGRLLSGRWMETALAFTEGEENDQKGPE